MKPMCCVCGLESKRTVLKAVSLKSDISGRSMKEIILCLFPSDQDFQLNASNEVLCTTCYNLLEQIDAFEMHLNRTRESLINRKKKKLPNVSPLLPMAPSTKVEPVLKVEPPETPFNTEDYFPDIGVDFLLDVQDEDFNVKKEIDNEFFGEIFEDSSSNEKDDDYSTVVKRRTKKTKPVEKTRKLEQELPEIMLKLGLTPLEDILKTSGKKPAEMEAILGMIKDFEADIAYLKAPANDAKDDWDMFLMRSGSELKAYGVTGELTCSECQETFDSVKKKVQHIIKTHPGLREKSYGCEYCPDLSFFAEEDVFAHVESEHGLKTTQNLHRTPLIVAGDDRHYCSNCGVLSSTELGFWYHWCNRHSTYKTASCLLCSEATDSVSLLRRHVLVDHCGYKYQCPDCDFDTDSCETVLLHLKNHDEALVEEKKSRIIKRKTKPSNEDVMSRKVPLDNVSHLVKRSREIAPLTVYERATFNSDQYLVSTNTISNDLKLAPHLKAEMDEQIDLLKLMPDIIENQEQSLHWDIALLKSEATKLIFGIPGESRCFYCDLISKNPSEKQSHILSVHGGGENGESFKCTICAKFWSSEETAFHHVKSKHLDLWKQDQGEKRAPVYLADGTFQCRYCTLVATSELAFWVHTLARHKKFKQVRCEMCSQLCCNGPQFRRHVLIYHGQYRYKCPECPKSFRPIDSFKTHIKDHERQKEIDNFEKKKAERAAQGLPDEEEQPPPQPLPKKGRKLPAEFVTCELCGKESRGEKFHAKHMYTQHGIEMKMACSDCGKECSSIRDLENHRRADHSVASCHFCGRSFFSASHLTNHLKHVHGVGSKTDDYICEICARTFPTKSYLRIHMRTHKEKHIKCQLCSKMFRWESALRSHLAAAHAHTAQMHSCEFCGKQFKDKSNLKSHRYTHLDVKPHSCSKCGRGFIRKDMMLTHEKNCRL